MEWQQVSILKGGQYLCRHLLPEKNIWGDLRKYLPTDELIVTVSCAELDQNNRF